jgi:tetratricopeptide (TPR) repeat protein
VNITMRRWLILVVGGLTSLPLLAQEAGSQALPSHDPVLMPAGPVNEDGSIQDSLGFVTARPAPDKKEGELDCFKQVDYLRKHGDNIMAISYLRQIVTNGNILPQDRARAMLELSDSLAAEHQEAESLCWLRIWVELYPTRPEIGAVAYRIGSLYSQMGLPDLARDAFYTALAHTVNLGQVENADDLKLYSRLTTGTLWGLAANEYGCAQWNRAAELFDRYRKEATSASPLSLEKAAFLQADCYYQLRQIDNATGLYEDTLLRHPFNPLAPEARLRLYHLYLIKKSPEKARDELQSLVWTVRTVWPKDEGYWQKQTAQLLMALNEKDISILPPLLQRSTSLPPEGKTWQELLNHYDALVSYQVGTTNANMDSPVNSSLKTEAKHGLLEDDDYQAMSRYLDQLLPPRRTASTD